MTTVAIHGQGVAARCCAWLLEGAGLAVAPVEHRVHGRVPAVVVSQSTQRLMADVFGQPDLFAGLPRIERRVVAWGPNAEPVSLPHAAVVIAEDGLAARLPSPGPAAATADWTIFASGAVPSVKQQFGTRLATVVAAEIKNSEAACWVESLAAGWLFLIPGWLIAVGGDPSTLLAESRLVAGQILALGEAAGTFPACPRIADPLGAPGWLACGASAMAFDPICGDGTGNAVREAILASAAIRAAARGEDVDLLLAHYRARLTAAFHKHLQICLQFYRAANTGPWWEAEIAALEQGMAWCAERLAAAPPFRFRLEGFDLRPVR